VSEHVIGNIPNATASDWAAGFYGKIPSRGDFVSGGLPRSFIDPWDRWLQEGMAASRIALGEGWISRWLKAPIWSFVLAPGICGPEAAIGVWMPSVDRVGRHFPLTVVAIVSDGRVGNLMREGGGFLAAAEQAGLAALESDISPDDLLARVRAAVAAAPAGTGVDPAEFLDTRVLWWRLGTALIPFSCFAGGTMPDPGVMSRMIDAPGKETTA